MVSSIALQFRSLLLDPVGFFEEREPAETFPYAMGVLLVFAITLVVALFLVADILAGAIEGPLTVDNPDRPPEGICESFEDVRPDGCDEPERIERSPGSLMRDAVSEYVGAALAGVFVMWVLGTVLFNLTARMLGGTPSLSGTAALAAWAALPEFLRLGAGVVAIHVAVSDVTVTDPESESQILVDALASVEPYLAVATLLTFLWQWYLVTGGLASDADLSRPAAAFAAVLPLTVALLFALA